MTPFKTKPMLEFASDMPVIIVATVTVVEIHGFYVGVA
jgi:hypothetical protein